MRPTHTIQFMRFNYSGYGKQTFFQLAQVNFKQLFKEKHMGQYEKYSPY